MAYFLVMLLMIFLISSFVSNLFDVKVLDVMTFLVLVWTAIEAARARRSSNEANEISLLPLLTIEFEGKFLTEGVKFYIKNLGEGVAYNIQIKPWKCYFGDTGSRKHWERLEMRTMVKGTNALAKNERADLHVLVYRDGKHESLTNEGLKDFLTFMMTPSKDEPMKGGYINLKIEFKNAYSKNYFTVISTGSSGTNILQPATKLNWLNNLYWHIKIKWSQIWSTFLYHRRSVKNKKLGWRYPVEVIRCIPYWYFSDYTSPKL